MVNTPSSSSSTVPKGEVHPPLAPKILIVDDDPILRKMYSEKFQMEGFVVLTASSGKEALDLALNKKVDVVLLDILLPEMKGTEVLERLRADERGVNLVVLALTNNADPAERERAMKYGASEYIEKALYTPEKVVEVVKKRLQI